MKIAQGTVHIPSCSSCEYFGLVYGDPTCLGKFHDRINGDPHASLPCWEGNEREITFSIPVRAPAVLTRLLGAERIRVQEKQSVQVMEGGGKIVLKSDPKPELPGADACSSVATVEMEDCKDDSGGGCTVKMVVECTAAGPYGLVGAIESFMADTAKKNVEQLLMYCSEYVKELEVGGGLRGAAAEAVQKVPVLARQLVPVAPLSREGSVYYDTVEYGSGGSVEEEEDYSLGIVAEYLKLLARGQERQERALHTLAENLAQGSRYKIEFDVGSNVRNCVLYLSIFGSVYFLSTSLRK